MNRRSEKKGIAGLITSAAIPGALSLLLLYAACLFPTGQWGWTAVAGLGPLAVVASVGVKSGLLCWGGVSVLALLLLPNKFCALLFVLLFGIYPVIKSEAERMKQQAFGWVLKLAVFNLSITVLWFAMGALIAASLPQILVDNRVLFYCAGSIVFVVYDLGLTKLIQFYLSRVDRVIRRGTR